MRQRCAIFFGLLILLTGGCGAVVTPPNRVDHPATVYLHIEGRHSSLLLPVDALGPQSRHGRSTWVEYTYGDWRWFALMDTRPIVAARAVFGSPQATFGRRFVGSPPETAVPIIVDRARVDALQLELAARFARGQAHTPGGALYNPAYDLFFAHDRERYHALNNCNHLTARWLRRLGCRVDGPAITNRFNVRPTVQTVAPVAPSPPVEPEKSPPRAAAPRAVPPAAPAPPW